jgi:hypothetical protein
MQIQRFTETFTEKRLLDGTILYSGKLTGACMTSVVPRGHHMASSWLYVLAEEPPATSPVTLSVVNTDTEARRCRSYFPVRKPSVRNIHGLPHVLWRSRHIAFDLGLKLRP